VTEAIHEMTRLALETECEELRTRCEGTKHFVAGMQDACDMMRKERDELKHISFKKNEKQAYLRGFEDGATELGVRMSEILPAALPSITPWNKKDELLGLKAWEKRFGDSKTNL